MIINIVEDNLVILHQISAKFVCRSSNGRDNKLSTKDLDIFEGLLERDYCLVNHFETG